MFYRDNSQIVLGALVILMTVSFSAKGANTNIVKIQQICPYSIVCVDTYPEDCAVNSPYVSYSGSGPVQKGMYIFRQAESMIYNGQKIFCRYYNVQTGTTYLSITTYGKFANPSQGTICHAVGLPQKCPIDTSERQK